MLKDEHVLQLIAESGLDRMGGTLEQTTLLSNRIHVTPSTDDEIAVGNSKIGGNPDLHASVDWPMYDGKPLTFIAQIQLNEVPWKPEPLPQSGLLSFFYEAVDQPWGFDPEEAGQWKVIYVADMAGLERKAKPAELVNRDEAEAEALAVNFSVQTTLLPPRTLEMKRLGPNADEMDKYMDLRESVVEHNGANTVIHRFLGHPDPIQGDMQLQTQLVSNGINCGDAFGYRDPRREELEPGAEGWKLLLQIDSVEELGLIWGDFGMIYFWIHEDDLKNGDFERVCVILQCG
ncbi:YwqG family protein [Paenibacillus sp. FSL K6-1230]|uniref:YwqG family protein n=1 Tax=Paenibacillus sp. FSL K6-1230 TaxID=2921603 RepID=UPI0030F50A1D